MDAHSNATSVIHCWLANDGNTWAAAVKGLTPLSTATSVIHCRLAEDGNTWAAKVPRAEQTRNNQQTRNRRQTRNIARNNDSPFYLQTWY